MKVFPFYSPFIFFVRVTNNAVDRRRKKIPQVRRSSPPLLPFHIDFDRWKLNHNKTTRPDETRDEEINIDEMGDADIQEQMKKALFIGRCASPIRVSPATYNIMWKRNEANDPHLPLRWSHLISFRFVSLRPIPFDDGHLDRQSSFSFLIDLLISTAKNSFEKFFLIWVICKTLVTIFDWFVLSPPPLPPCQSLHIRNETERRSRCVKRNDVLLGQSSIPSSALRTLCSFLLVDRKKGVQIFDQSTMRVEHLWSLANFQRNEQFTKSN